MTTPTGALAALAGAGASSTFVLAVISGPSLLLMACGAVLASVSTVAFRRAVLARSRQPVEVYAAYMAGLRDGSRHSRRR
ncbi:hypothetical protein [Nonomuraea sp. CA-141351]|uniref:hypothetical protein n=1 Tax=Nonomuraea sp. CA-141351 TaxID=3239996 RepID=UPI003D92B0C9